ncbi:MAG: diguanylate cyclase [Gammaproteobacteria bacterium]|nr:diguanylate cyclase [Gammaproteobacteria bacterium]
MQQATTRQLMASDKRILIIDDDLEISSQIKKFLETEDAAYSVEVAANISQVDNLSGRFRPDITLINIKNPSEKSLALITQLKTYNPNMDCIILASQPHINNMTRSNLQLVSDILFKPLDTFKLLHSLELLFSRQSLQREKEATLRKYETLFNENDAIMFHLAKDGMVLDLNSAAVKLLSNDKQEIIGKALWSGRVTDLNPEFSRKLQDVFQNVQAADSRFETTMNDMICEKRLFSFNLKKVGDISSNDTEYLLEGNDITEQRSTEQKIRQLSYIDHLTGLCNHAWFYQTVSRALTNASRHRRCCAILSINIDNFTVFNETYGTHAGDEMLIEISRRLASCIRHGDIASRRSGDNFTLFLDEISDEEDAGLVAHRVCKTIAYHSPLDQEHPPVTASIGITIFPQDGKDARSLITGADKTMSSTKQDGKNSFRFYHEI